MPLTVFSQDFSQVNACKIAILINEDWICGGHRLKYRIVFFKNGGP